MCTFCSFIDFTILNSPGKMTIPHVFLSLVVYFYYIEMERSGSPRGHGAQCANRILAPLKNKTQNKKSKFGICNQGNVV